MENKVWTKEEIKTGIMTNDGWLCRSILAIYNKQTVDEQESETTKHQNGIGFNGCDAEILSSFAKQLEKYGRLSNKQLDIARKKMPKYSGQLVDIANKKI